MLLLLLLGVTVLIALAAVALSRATEARARLDYLLHELGRLQALETRLGRLEGELKRLQEAGARGTSAHRADIAAGTTLPPAAAAPPPTAPQAIEPLVPVPAPEALHSAPPTSGEFTGREAPPITPWPAAPSKPSRSRAEWEAFVGGKLLNRIGALALVLGVGFFLKYAFDNEWISEPVRVIIGALLGVVCLAGARRSRSKGMPIFAQGLSGGGLAILYLSVYASFNYYHLVSQPVAFLLMGAVTALAFAEGASTDSLAVGLLGWAGGFLTPFLLSTGEPNETGLFGYVALLDAAVLSLSLRKRGWDILSPLSLAATWAIFLLWHGEYYAAPKMVTALAFASLFWLLFHLDDVARLSRPFPGAPGLRHLFPVLNAAAFGFVLHDVLERDHHSWTAPSMLALAALYALTAFLARRSGRGSEDDRTRMLLTVSVLVALAAAVQYTGFTTVILWSVEAALLAWFAARHHREHLQTASVLLFFAAAVKFAGTDGAFAYSFPGAEDPVVNLRSLAYIAFALSLGAASGRARGSPLPSSRTFASWFSTAAALAIFAALTVTVNDIFSQAQSGRPPGPAHDLMFRRLMAIGCTWTVYSIPFFWRGLAKNRATLMVPALGALLLGAALVVIRGVAFDPIEAFHPLSNSRVAAFLVVLCGMAVHSALIDTWGGARPWLPELRTYIGFAAGVAVFSLLTGETRDFFERELSHSPHPGAAGYDEGRLLELRNLQQLAISGAWLAYSGLLMAVGIWRASKGLRFFAIGVFGLSILKIFLYDLSFLETLYRIFSVLGLGLILLAVSYAYQRFKGVLFGTAASDGGPGASA